MNEGKIIQKKLVSSQEKKTPEDIARIFSKLMFEGKVKAALKFVEANSGSGVLPATNDVINALKQKHPSAAKVEKHSLISGPLKPSNIAHFFDITEVSIQKAAMKTKGAGGPSQFDADQFRRILCSKHFKAEGKELREEIALFACKIGTEVVDPETLEAYVSCRLIPLNKDPGIRPIGVGEVLRRIVGKSISWCLKDEIQEAAGPLQMSSGLEGGSEAAIHAMRNIFETESADGVILVDASNAFNSMNRTVALHNIQYICPPLAVVLINTYRRPSRLILPGGKEILSLEGTTQGDPLAMQFYALTVTPLITTLRILIPEVSQVWLADDATGQVNCYN